jgi:hypothetical protein
MPNVTAPSRRGWRRRSAKEYNHTRPSETRGSHDPRADLDDDGERILALASIRVGPMEQENAL